MAALTPKQAIPKGPKLFQQLGGNLTDRIASIVIEQLQPVRDNIVLHDNACGMGAATKALFASQSFINKSVQVEATDINPMLVQMMEQVCSQQGWPVRVQQMNSEKLDFKEDAFTHSITNFGLPLLDDPTKGATEIYRTLAPGGIATISWWHQNPGGEALTETHRRIRPIGTKLRIAPKEGLEDPENLKKLLSSGGFDIRRMKVTSTNITLRVDDLKYFVEGMWTMVGEPSPGWTKGDEESWDEAIRLMIEKLESHPGCKKTGPTAADLELSATILIAEK
ncbi:hypothetical protein MMC10_001889 [Thelotrema lepadinum]|nr:hypothetical protein [Thelotrema lepadinum]